MKKKIHLFLFIFIVAASKAQDIHWSQPTSILIYQNPSFTGLTNKYSIGLNFRDQWSSINKSYRTYALSGDYRFAAESKKANLATGAMLYKDVSANGSYMITSGGITLAGQVNANENSRLSVGINYNFTQNRINGNKQTWGNQFDGQKYNSALSTGEDAPGPGKTFSDVGLGVSYLYHKKSGTVDDNNPNFLLAGYSVNHVNRPEISATGGAEKLALKHTLMFTGVRDIQNNIALKPTIIFYAQGKMLELTGGALLRFGIGQTSRYTGIRKSSFFSAGFLYRFKDAIIPTMEFEKPDFVTGISYDVNLSKFSQASKYRGGVEIYIRMKMGNIFSNNNKQQAEDTKPSY